jgi:hypothetical protein
MATLQQQPLLLNATESLSATSVPHLTPTSTSVLAAIVAVAVLYALTGKRSKARLPPGPPGLPVVGNILDIPKSRPWVKFAEWTEKYGELRGGVFPESSLYQRANRANVPAGPMYTLKLGRTNMLVIGRAEPAIDLLDKRSAKYSSRARLIMTSELVSRGLRMTFMPYSDLWRRERRLLHQLTSPAASSTYEPIQEQESTQIVLDMLNDPENHWGHCQVRRWHTFFSFRSRPLTGSTRLQRYAGSTIMQIAFNKRAPTCKDPAITRVSVSKPFFFSSG